RESARSALRRTLRAAAAATPKRTRSRSWRAGWRPGGCRPPRCRWGTGRRPGGTPRRRPAAPAASRTWLPRPPAAPRGLAAPRGPGGAAPRGRAGRAARPPGGVRRARGADHVTKPATTPAAAQAAPPNRNHLPAVVFVITMLPPGVL